jgi:hypothetical protein
MARKKPDGPPALGAFRAAELLTGQLGIDVTPEGVRELARQGLIPRAGTYKGWPLYDQAALEAFADKQAAAGAARAGKLRTADQAAAYLKVRRADLNHLIRCKALKPAGHAPNPNNRRCDIPLYRTGDLDALLARQDIDWAAVRATPRGRPSPLIRVAEAENILAVLAGLPGPS